MIVFVAAGGTRSVLRSNSRCSNNASVSVAITLKNSSIEVSLLQDAGARRHSSNILRLRRVTLSMTPLSTRRPMYSVSALAATVSTSPRVADDVSGRHPQRLPVVPRCCVSAPGCSVGGSALPLRPEGRRLADGLAKRIGRRPSRSVVGQTGRTGRSRRPHRRTSLLVIPGVEVALVHVFEHVVRVRFARVTRRPARHLYHALTAVSGANRRVGTATPSRRFGSVGRPPRTDPQRRDGDR